MTENPLAPAWLSKPGDANELARNVWPTNLNRGADGTITIAGVRLSDLAEEFGTPLYLIDEADARSRARGFRVAFEQEFAKLGVRTTVYYAAKAFLCSDFARWMVAEGLNIDVASRGELALVLAAGIDPERIGLHGNNKSRTELERSVAAGVGTINIDNASEIELIDELARNHNRIQSVRLRVRTGVHAHTHEHLATSHDDQKFGVSISEAPALVARIRACPNLNFRGLHSHIGSQIFGIEGFAEAISRLMALHAELLADGPVEELNLGGGFGIPYVSTDEAPRADFLAGEFARLVSDAATALGVPVPNIAIEPGRAIAGTAGITIYRAGSVKDVQLSTDQGTAARRYLSVDGGMSDNPRPALYQADYSARLANRSSGSDPVLCRIVGKHCESGDIVVMDEYLPGDVSGGDLIAVAATGAYCWSLSSNYNYLGRPAVVSVRNGVARMIIRGETESDLLGRDCGLDASPLGGGK